MIFKPMADRVLIRRVDPETRTSAGFIIPDTSVVKANRGTVVAVGPGKLLKDGKVVPIADVKVGDVIMFEGIGINVKINGEQLVVLQEEEIIAIVD
jgi:chaperonin GroES